MSGKEITIYPETIKDQNSEVIEKIGFAIQYALDDYEETSDLLWGAMYLCGGNVVFRCDNFMDYTLEDYEDALAEHQR